MIHREAAWRFRSKLFIAIAGVPFACGDRAGGPAERPAIASSDSAGVEIIEVPVAMLDSLPHWTFSEEPVLSIGQAEGEAPYLFYRVNAARRLSSGEILVVDGQSRELRVFGEDGQFRRGYGGRGGGPGEFEGFPLTVSQTDGARVSIYDVPPQRITTLDLLTDSVTTRLAPTQCREPHEDALGSCGLSTLLPDGTIIARRASSPFPPLSEDGRLTLRQAGDLRYGILEGEMFHVLDSIRGGVTVSIGFGSDYFSGSGIFGPEGAFAVSASGLFFADPHRYEIREWGAEGTLRRVIRVMTPTVPVTEALLDRYRQWADTASNIPAVSREYLASLKPEGTVPFFGSVRVDRAGRIWVQDYRPFWAFGPRGPAAWTVFGADGTPQARLEGGAPGSILEIGEDYILVNRTGELDEERVQLYRIEGVER